LASGESGSGGPLISPGRGFVVWKLLLEGLTAFLTAPTGLHLCLRGTLSHEEPNEETDKEDDRYVEDMGSRHESLHFPGLGLLIGAEASLEDSLAEHVF